MINIEPQELIKRVSALCDQDLSRIAYGDPSHYICQSRDESPGNLA